MEKVTYVKQDGMIYKIEEIEMRKDGWLNITLELVCGYDYIDVDGSNAQGFVGKDNFVEEAEFEYISCDIMNESITAALEYNGYKIIEKLPTIHGQGEM